MNPLPGYDAVPTGALAPHGSSNLAALLAIAALLLAFGFVLWSARRMTRRRETLRCPTHHRRATVHFLLAPDGGRLDVLRCSLVGWRRVTCRKQCLHNGLA